MNDKHLLLFFIAATLFFTVFAFFLIYFMVVQHAKKNSYLIERQQMLKEHQEERIEEQERILNTVSKEMHDNIGQQASQIGMHMRWIQKQITDADQLNIVEKVIVLADQILSNTRQLSHALNGEYIMSNGLKKVLEQELEHIDQSTNTRCKLITTGDIEELDAERQLVIFRIAQEALHNAVKHASAKEIQVRLEHKDNRFLMSIADNGYGFLVDRLTKMPGIGLANMRSRAKLLKGNLVVKSTPMKGTTIMLCVNEHSIK